MSSYYNELDPYCAAWLRNLIAADLIPPGDVDERSIADVDPSDLDGYTQCHFFAGLGGWAYAARLAGWPDDRPLWTGSPPCQPYSCAGQKRGTADERHLWPHLFRLLAAVRPPVGFFEQVAAAAGGDWLDGVLSNLEGSGYATETKVLPACAVNAPHRRDRLWIVADRECINDDGCRSGAVDDRRQRHASTKLSAGENSGSGHVGKPIGQRPQGQQQARAAAWPAFGACANHWADTEWLIGPDGKARRAKSGVRLLAHGISGRVAIQRTTEQAGAAAQETHWYNRIGALRALGNAIVPQVAAEVIAAYLETA